MPRTSSNKHTRTPHFQYTFASHVRSFARSRASDVSNFGNTIRQAHIRNRRKEGAKRNTQKVYGIRLCTAQTDDTVDKCVLCTFTVKKKVVHRFAVVCTHQCKPASQFVRPFVDERVNRLAHLFVIRILTSYSLSRDRSCDFLVFGISDLRTSYTTESDSKRSSVSAKSYGF